MNDPLAEALLDSFDCDIEIEWENAIRYSVAAFGIEGRNGVVTFSSIEDPPRSWSVEFDFQKASPARSEVVALGEDMRLYGCLFEAVRKFIENRKPTTIDFALEDEGLTRIFRACLRHGASPVKMLGYVIAPSVSDGRLTLMKR